MSEHERTTQSGAMRWVLTSVGFAALIAIAVLLFLPSTVHLVVDDGNHPGYTTECSSIVAAGFPRDLGTSQDRMVAQGANSTTDSDGPAYAACQSRRTFFVAGIGILAIPASALMFLAATRRPQGRAATHIDD
ncbi:hypothetical protein SAMN06295879_2967 [Agreia bicolorata]|uniref:Uncharacterized protein n=1 Tax=Agreia bicolorata TaxID=110935 RepID=A0A1T4YG33_9MICO|nr:hypothetical protein [Agreia bicolorata]SKB00251.1 hypothetical protein SAMN06295879_2967 [Agreia bicolorata]